MEVQELERLYIYRGLERIPDAFYYDFSNTSGAGFIYSLIRKAQEDSRKDMTLLLDDKKHVRICRKEFPTKDDDTADIIEAFMLIRTLKLESKIE